MTTDTRESREGVSLQWLKPSDLEVESVAQREFRPGNADKIVKNYDPEKIGEFKVSHRGGRFFVTDGQHRRAALIELGLGHEPVPCVVREDQTVSEDAKRFLAANVENTKTGSIDAFRIAVVAEDPVAVEINEVLKQFDLRVSYAAGPNDISAVAALHWIYRRGGKSLIVRALTLIEATWGRDRQGRDGHMLKAVALLLDKVGDQIDLHSFAQKVQADSTPGRVLGVARTHQMATRKALYIQAAEVLVTIYNKQRTTRRISIT